MNMNQRGSIARDSEMPTRNDAAIESLKFELGFEQTEVCLVLIIQFAYTSTLQY